MQSLHELFFSDAAQQIFIQIEILNDLKEKCKLNKGDEQEFAIIATVFAQRLNQTLSALAQTSTATQHPESIKCFSNEPNENSMLPIRPAPLY